MKESILDIVEQVICRESPSKDLSDWMRSFVNIEPTCNENTALGKSTGIIHFFVTDKAGYNENVFEYIHDVPSITEVGSNISITLGHQELVVHVHTMPYDVNVTPFDLCNASTHPTVGYVKDKDGRYVESTGIAHKEWDDGLRYNDNELITYVDLIESRLQALLGGSSLIQHMGNQNWMSEQTSINLSNCYEEKYTLRIELSSTLGTKLITVVTHSDSWIVSHLGSLVRVVVDNNLVYITVHDIHSYIIKQRFLYHYIDGSYIKLSLEPSENIPGYALVNNDDTEN